MTLFELYLQPLFNTLTQNSVYPRSNCETIYEKHKLRNISSHVLLLFFKKYQEEVKPGKFPFKEV